MKMMLVPTAPKEINLHTPMQVHAPPMGSFNNFLLN